MQTGRSDLDAMLKVASIPADEPVFILRAQDVVAADAVRAWAAMHLAQSGCSPAVAESAFVQADRMDRWPVKKLPGADHWSEAEQKQLAYGLSQRANRRRIAEASNDAIALAERRGYDLAKARFRSMLRGPEMTMILRFVNLQISPIASLFRETGEAIPRTDEDEQAFVYSWLLGLALENGEAWATHAQVELSRRKAMLPKKEATA